MFNFFKKKDKLKSLQKKKEKLLEKAFKISHSNRKEADLLTSKAEEIQKEIDNLINEKLDLKI